MSKVYITNDFHFSMLGVNLESAELRITPYTVEELRAVLEKREYYTNINDDIYERGLIEHAIDGIFMPVPDRVVTKLRLYTGDLMYVVQYIYNGQSIFREPEIKTKYARIYETPESAERDFRDYIPYFRKIEVLSKKGILR